jgi:hypothetical protein
MLYRAAYLFSSVFAKKRFYLNFIYCKISCRIPGGFCPDTAEDIAPKINVTACLHRQPIRCVVYLHILNRQKQATRQLFVCHDNAHAVVNSNLASKNYTLCRRRHHANEVQQLFSTHSLSDVSWGMSAV